MNQETHTSTLPPEQILSELISTEKRAELIERLNKLKSTLNQVEDRMAEQNRGEEQKRMAVEELNRRIDILQRLAAETRANIQTLVQVSNPDLYYQPLTSMVKNLDKVNKAYGLILDGLTA
jgi:uncharacterized coiled-coil DUF342 family protein